MLKSYILFFAISLFYPAQANALDLASLKAAYFAGDHKAAIKEGEKILETAEYSSDLDELYYFLGLSYLREGNYLRASDIFEIIINEFNDSAFKEEAQIGLCDTDLVKGDFEKAQACYRGLIIKNPDSKFKLQLQKRLSQAKVKQAALTSGVKYSVQVGAFSNLTNAVRFLKRLEDKGYPVFMEEPSLKAKKRFYRVKVGKFDLRAQAEEVAKELTQNGYSTKISP